VAQAYIKNEKNRFASHLPDIAGSTIRHRSSSDSIAKSGTHQSIVRFLANRRRLPHPQQKATVLYLLRLSVALRCSDELLEKKATL
jgi:hypothetical protein